MPWWRRCRRSCRSSRKRSARAWKGPRVFTAACAGRGGAAPPARRFGSQGGEIQHRGRVVGGIFHLEQGIPFAEQADQRKARERFVVPEQMIDFALDARGACRIKQHPREAPPDDRLDQGIPRGGWRSGWGLCRHGHVDQEPRRAPFPRAGRGCSAPSRPIEPWDNSARAAYPTTVENRGQIG